MKINARIVLVGDPDQLPSVGAGNVFREIIETKIVPVTVLDQIFRQSKDSLIAYNAKFINEGNTKLFTDRTLFSCLVIVRKIPLKRLQNGIVWRYRRVALRMCRFFHLSVQKAPRRRNS